MKTEKIFKDIADFRSYVDGLEADTTLEQLRPSIRSASTSIASIIGKAVFQKLSEDLDLYSYGNEMLKTAVATSALYRYQIFLSTKKNNTEAKFYKYQHEEIKEHHIEAFWSAMDELLDWLDENADNVPEWKESQLCKIRESLPVKNAAEFDGYYGIDRSSYFYSKVLFLLRTIWSENIRPVLGRLVPDEALMERSKRILCYWTMAEAVLKFDVTELPRSIRYDFNHEYTKSSDPQTRDRLHADLMSKVNSWMKMVESAVKSATGGNVSGGVVNAEENKFFYM